MARKNLNIRYKYERDKAQGQRMGSENPVFLWEPGR